MKIVLSRKGFDSGTGGTPSPILPSGRLASIPIPETSVRKDLPTYNDLLVEDVSLGQIVSDLTRARVRRDTKAHLDPDLALQRRPRLPGWRPLFGQAGAAEAHLQREGVGCGDLFLFFGWFREVRRRDGRYEYVPRAPDVHLLFGWLQIADRVPVIDSEQLPEWAHGHPHYKRDVYHRLDSIYVATETLKTPFLNDGIAGGGEFERVAPARTLTASGESRSRWHVPEFFAPGLGSPGLSYHRNPKRWQVRDRWAALSSVARGQEFVLELAESPDMAAWLRAIFADGI